MCTPNRTTSQQRGRREEESSGPGTGLLWAVGGLALVGAGVAAYLYFNSDSEESNRGIREMPLENPTSTSSSEGSRDREELNNNFQDMLKRRNISQENCNICLDTLNQGTPNQRSLLLRCGHVFHEQCINNWLQTKEYDGQCPNCPNCRAPDPTNVSGLNLHPYCLEC